MEEGIEVYILPPYEASPHRGAEHDEGQQGREDGQARLRSGRISEVQALMESLTPHWRGWHTVPNSGHWVQYEAAQAFTPLLLSVLA